MLCAKISEIGSSLLFRLFKNKLVTFFPKTRCIILFIQRESSIFSSCRLWNDLPWKPTSVENCCN